MPTVPLFDPRDEAVARQRARELADQEAEMPDTPHYVVGRAVFLGNDPRPTIFHSNAPTGEPLTINDKPITRVDTNEGAEPKPVKAPHPFAGRVITDAPRSHEDIHD